MSKTILVVDDTPANLRLLANLLTGQGYRVRPAPNGERALASCQKERPDLILLDINMPDLDGYAVCRRLKADPQTQAVPIIFISALNDVFDKVTAFSVGGVDYITKPFQVEEVLARVQTHLHLRALQQQLQAQNAALQEQNSELEAFAGTVAHDLKNPLASIIASLSVLPMVVTPTPAAQEVMDLSSKAAHKMSNIIDELLLLASVRREQVALEPLDMEAIVAQAWTRLDHLRGKYQPELVLPTHWPTAQGYAPWVEEVWANYLSNGLKYGGRPPRLALGATAQADGQWRFWVRDNGPGLSAAAQAQLFTEFTRLDKIRAQGHGLGLSIVRRIMHKLGGSAGVASTLGEGSTFYFTLPAGETA